MSNRRRIRRQPEPSSVTALLAALDGGRVPGGCGACDAYQVVRAHAYGTSNVHVIEVHHDERCSVLASHEPVPQR